MKDLFEIVHQIQIQTNKIEDSPLKLSGTPLGRALMSICLGIFVASTPEAFDESKSKKSRVLAGVNMGVFYSLGFLLALNNGFSENGRHTNSGNQPVEEVK